jgi:hypothetical protein
MDRLITGEVKRIQDGISSLFSVNAVTLLMRSSLSGASFSAAYMFFVSLYLLQQVAAMDRLITGEVKRIQDGIRNEIKTLKKKLTYLRLS